jgi:CheY-like chemotaxis protein
MSPEEPIIFVDDDTDDHFIFAEVCTKMGLRNETKFFKNGQDLLDYLLITADKPFIIFCDVNMPRMSGLQLRQKINENDFLKKKSIPFVFLTTAANRDQIREAYDLAVQGFFIKEQSFVQTATTLKLVLDYWDKCRHPTP